MKIFLALAAALIIGAALFFLIPSTGKGESVQGKTIQYFPKANIYFDVENEVYYLLSEDKWSKVGQLTEEQTAYLGPQVKIESPANPVWQQNEHHRLIYATELYTSADDYNRKYIEDSLSSLPKKLPEAAPVTDSATSLDEGRKKSGVRTFFDRLFKKKSRNRETSQ